MIIGWLIAYWALTVTAAPEVSFPINSQVPPVARVSEAYEFTFAASTFHSSQDSLSYSLENAPSWLRLDNATRKLYGTPKQEDLGSSVFQLVGTDLSGSSKMDVIFVTLEGSGLHPVESILSQLSQFGPTSNPDALLLRQLQDFSFSFSKATFSLSTSDIAYYSTTEDASPLPSWLQFDPQNLRFFGNSPPLVSPNARPQVYGVKLYASRVAGFAEATVTFQLIVGYHILEFESPSVTVNVSRGDIVSVGLKNQLQLDGKAVQDSDLSNVGANVPYWVRLNARNVSLWGNVPATASDTNVTVTVTDFNGDLASTVVFLKILRLFTGILPVVNATAGQPFNYTVSLDLLRYDDVKITADLGDASSWLQYDENLRNFRGSVPKTLLPRLLLIQLHAFRGSATDNETLQIQIQPPGSSAPSSTFPRTTSSSQSLTQSTTVISSITPTSRVEEDSRAGKNRLNVVLLITLPILCSALAAILSLVCWRWKKARRERREYLKKRSHQPRLTTKELDAEENSEKQGESVAQFPLEGNQPHPPVPAPRVDLPWTDSTVASEEYLSRVLAAGENLNTVRPVPGAISTNTMASTAMANQTSRQRIPNSQTDQPIHFTPRESYNFSRKRIPLRNLQSRIEHSGIRKRYSRPISRVSPSGSGLPTRRSGAGHGSGGPPGFNEVRQSWQHPGSSQTSEDSRALSAVLDNFPQPPPEIEAEAEKENVVPGKVPSMRLVDDNPAYSEFLRNRRHHKDLEPNARFSTINSSRQYLDRRVPYSYLRSSRSMQSYSEIADYSMSDSANWRQTGTSQSSSRRPTISSTRPSRGSSNRLIARSSIPRSGITANQSERLSSTESISDSEWEDELLLESQDANGRRWYTSGVLPEGPSSCVGSFQTFRRRSRAPMEPRRPHNLQTPGLSNTGPGIVQGTTSRGREWRLGESPGEQPVSIIEGQLERSERIERGDLAFI